LLFAGELSHERTPSVKKKTKQLKNRGF